MSNCFRLPSFSRRKTALAACLVTLSGVPLSRDARAQNSPSGGARSGASAIIGPDDVLDVVILRHPEFSATGVVVPGNGTVTLPVVGQVRAAGKTVAQFDAELTRRLRVRLLRPEVGVSIAKAAPRPVYVLGQVKSPGVLEFKNGWRITQALAASGGLSVDSDLAAVVVSRGRATIADVALLPILRSPSGAGNIALRVGDTLRFYERVVRVNVSGAVAKPGIYAIPRGGGVVEAIGLAGGPSDAASLTRATLRRSDGTVRAINLYAALRQGQAAQNLTLREGDVLSVPEFKDRVSVLGAVKTPGFYGLEDGAGTKIVDVLARAGGAGEGAALTKATLRRANGQSISLNLYRLLILGESDNNLALQNGDVLTIPETRGITVLGEVKLPGTFKIEEGTLPRASDAIARAGGLTIKPEAARISVSRVGAGGRVQLLQLNAVSLLELSNAAQNTPLVDGDILSVSALKNLTVFINGQVKTPNAFEIKEGDGITAVLARAGGPTDDAALSQVTITSRDGQTRTVDATLSRTGRSPSLPLRDGDSIVVPYSNARVLVVGAVNRPGSYALPEDRPLNIGDALSFAGGPQAGTRVTQVVLLRPAPGAVVVPGNSNQGPGVQRLTYRLDRAEKGQLAATQPVFKGDVIYIPEGKPRRSTLDLLAAFLPAASFFIR